MAEDPWQGHLIWLPDSGWFVLALASPAEHGALHVWWHRHPQTLTCFGIKRCYWGHRWTGRGSIGPHAGGSWLEIVFWAEGVHTGKRTLLACHGRATTATHWWADRQLGPAVGGRGRRRGRPHGRHAISAAGHTNSWPVPPPRARNFWRWLSKYVVVAARPSPGLVVRQATGDGGFGGRWGCRIFLAHWSCAATSPPPSPPLAWVLQWSLLSGPLRERPIALKEREQKPGERAYLLPLLFLKVSLAFKSVCRKEGSTKNCANKGSGVEVGHRPIEEEWKHLLWFSLRAYKNIIWPKI